MLQNIFRNIDYYSIEKIIYKLSFIFENVNNYAGNIV